MNVLKTMLNESFKNDMYRENGWTNTNRKHTEMTIQVNKNNR
jgi:hypothetical protein